MSAAPVRASPIPTESQAAAGPVKITAANEIAKATDIAPIVIPASAVRRASVILPRPVRNAVVDKIRLPNSADFVPLHQGKASLGAVLENDGPPVGGPPCSKELSERFFVLK
jgi:hypothetical protein